MKYRVTFTRDIARRVSKSSIHYDSEGRVLGFHWWYWMPCYSHVGNFRSSYVCYASLTWLCFSIGVTFWPYNKKGPLSP